MKQNSIDGSATGQMANTARQSVRLTESPFDQAQRLNGKRESPVPLRKEETELLKLCGTSGASAPEIPIFKV